MLRAGARGPWKNRFGCYSRFLRHPWHRLSLRFARPPVATYRNTEILRILPALEFQPWKSCENRNPAVPFPFMSILEEPIPETRVPKWRTDFARALLLQKERAKELLAARREKFSLLETELGLRLAEVAEELAREQTAALEQKILLDSERTSLETRQAELQQQREDLGAQVARWETAQGDARTRHQELLAQLQQQFAELQVRQEEIETAQEQLHRERAELTQREATFAAVATANQARQTEIEQQSRQFAQAQAELAEEQSHLALEWQDLKERQQETERQRRSIARQLRAQKKELAAELELLRQESGSSSTQGIELQLRCSELQGICDRLREEGAELSLLRNDLQDRLSTAQQLLAQKQGEWSQAQKQADEMQARLQQAESQRAEYVREREQWLTEKQKLNKELEQVRAESRNDLTSTHERLASEQTAAVAELKRLREENKQLEDWLTEAEAQTEAAKAEAEAATAAASAAKSSAAAGSKAASSQEMTDLRRRLELATNECRDLKGKNADLQDQLAKARQAGQKSAASSPSPSTTSGGMDWESLKQRMLANLEADFDDSDPAQKADRLTVETAVQMTDKALAAKDQEIQAVRREVEELRELLENQASSIGQFAVGAAAFAGMLDKDEVVRQERLSLQKMQESLHEQLKKAEIDISMERARIARDRAELDEKLHALQREQAQRASSDPGSGGDSGKKPPRGRWLSRLGLSDDK